MIGGCFQIITFSFISAVKLSFSALVDKFAFDITKTAVSSNLTHQKSQLSLAWPVLLGTNC